MSFSDRQLKKLATPLDAARVMHRQQEGRTLSYIEGWFAIAEANRIFGYDGWDREMVHCELVFARGRDEGAQASYRARVRVRVRTSSATIVREGTGFGQAKAAFLGDAHERALKAAETDATKRALATFGGRFGLMLYNKEQRPPNSPNLRKPESGPSEPGGATKTTSQSCWQLVGADGTSVEVRSAESFCSALRQLIEAASDRGAIDRLLQANTASLASLRAIPSLTNAQGTHYADILEGLIAARRKALGAAAPPVVVETRAAAHPVVPQETPQIAAPAATVGPAGEQPDCADPIGAPTSAPEDPAPKANPPALVRRYLPVPAYPLAKLFERLAPPSAADPSGSDGSQLQEAEGAVASTTESADDTSPIGPGPASPIPQAAVIEPAPKPAFAPTRRSQIGGGYSIDKSVFANPSERHLRSKAHLVSVAARPCLLCEAQPCHAHHITFAQPRGLSQKVSDEFTVPLCILHHNELHASHNEASWWRSHGVEPLAHAKALWLETTAEHSS